MQQLRRTRHHHHTGVLPVSGWRRECDAKVLRRSYLAHLDIYHARSLQQLSECTDGRGADIGTQLERVNQHCVTGFPDVHMMLIMTELNGTMEAEAINPESEEQKECRVEVEDGTRVRMTEYISDYFTDEAYLTDALALGPVATNIAVTQSMQFYGGGVFYSPDECQVLNHNLFNRQ